MSDTKRKRLRNIFWMLFIVLMIACVVLNKRLGNVVSEGDYKKVSVSVLDVKKTFRFKYQQSKIELIQVTVLYKGEKHKLKGAPNYDMFLRLRGSTYDALLYKDKLYYDLPSLRTSTPTGILYFSCMALDFACFVAALTISQKKKAQKEEPKDSILKGDIQN